jgi:predicted protein tyrosine phosphatase
MFNKQDRVISISTPGMIPTNIQGAGEVLYTAFHDIKERIELNNIDPKQPKIILEPVTREQIQEIVDKVKEWDALREYVDVTVHCDAGVSRSGAVAAYIFAYTMCPFPQWDFNTAPGPNTYMLQLFKELTGFDPAETMCEPARGLV